MASLARPAANRAVHLRITPRPSNLGESREIMRLISQFGEVEYFKNLKYDALSAPNAALVIYKEEGAAQECLKRSPIRFRMGKVVSFRQAQQQWESGEEGSGEVAEKNESGNSMNRQEQGVIQRGPMGTPFALSNPQTRTLSTSSLPTPQPNPIRMPFDPYSTSPEPTSSDSRLFQITTNPTNRHFRDQINHSHYHGTFSIDSKMPGQEDLAKKVPVVGLSCVDWRKGQRPWRVLERERRRLGSLDREGLGKGGYGKRVGWMGRREGDGVEVVRDDERAERDGDGPVVSGVTETDSYKGASHGEEDALSGVMTGWEKFFPGISSGQADSVERYSRKRK